MKCGGASCGMMTMRMLVALACLSVLCTEKEEEEEGDFKPYFDDCVTDGRKSFSSSSSSYSQPIPKRAGMEEEEAPFFKESNFFLLARPEAKYSMFFITMGYNLIHNIRVKQF